MHQRIRWLSLNKKIAILAIFGLVIIVFVSVAALNIQYLDFKLDTPDTKNTDMIGNTDVKIEETKKIRETIEEVILPEQLTILLQKSGIEKSEIQSLSQIIIVDSDQTEAKIYLYEYTQEGIWQQNGDVIAGYVGKNGTTKDKKEGDKKTPKGLYSMPLAFGICQNVESNIPFQVIRDTSYWVDDPASKYYNQWVEMNQCKDWKSAEHLIEYSKQYEYAIVIDYNMNPIVPGNGSAIFLHCGNRATVGCVATDRNSVIKILSWLKSEDESRILII